MRDGIVGAFIDHDLSPASFAQVTQDDRLFRELALPAERTDRGRRFLKGVFQSLKSNSTLSPRIEILERLF